MIAKGSLLFGRNLESYLFYGWGNSPYYGRIDEDTKALESGWPSLRSSTTPVNGFDISPNGRRLVVVHGAPAFTVIDLNTNTVEDGWPSTIGVEGRGCGFSADGRKIVLTLLASSSENSYKVIDVATQQIETGWPTDTRSGNVAVPLDNSGSRMAIGIQPSPTSEPGLYFLTFASKTRSLISSVTGVVRDLAVSPDFTRLAIVGDTGTGDAAILDIASETIEAGWPNLDLNVGYGTAFSPDGTLVAFIGGGGISSSAPVYIVDVATKELWTEVPNITSPSLNITGHRLAFSPDSTKLAIKDASSDSPGFWVLDLASKTYESGWPEFGVTHTTNGGLFWKER